MWQYKVFIAFSYFTLNLLGIENINRASSIMAEAPHFNYSVNKDHYIQHELAQHPVSSRILCGALAGVVAKTGSIYFYLSHFIIVT